MDRKPSKTTALRVRFTKAGYSILARGRVVLRTKDHDSAISFACGWYACDRGEARKRLFGLRS